MNPTAAARITCVWATLCVITLLSWLLGHTDHTARPTADTTITVAVLTMAVIKGRLVIQYFMEVRTGPRWLRLFIDIWLLTLWAAALAIYLY
ncbi:cytochrome C oxidase subunit IV family protein [Nocardia pseudovaccinii]|uniref:cytochrome C oxidase subunit IV family protein n=1 Tax=Nocardia pseudovaccinii TaxID=189540 RepID=UPI0007A39FBD|nr:cytochrome C oxidase subunit IV family protein [Nocardia pseudovaccinii]